MLFRSDLVVADEIFRRAEMQTFLRVIQKSAVADKVEFNGIPEPVRIWRVPML